MIERAEGKLLTSRSSDKTIRFWEVQTHELLKDILPGSIVYDVAISPRQHGTGRRLP